MAFELVICISSITVFYDVYYASVYRNHLSNNTFFTASKPHLIPTVGCADTHAPLLWDYQERKESHPFLPPSSKRFQLSPVPDPPSVGIFPQMRNAPKGHLPRWPFFFCENRSNTAYKMAKRRALRPLLCCAKVAPMTLFAGHITSDTTAAVSSARWAEQCGENCAIMSARWAEQCAAVLSAGWAEQCLSTTTELRYYRYC